MVNLNDFDSTCMSVCLSVFMYSSEEFALTNSNAIKKKVIFVRTSYIYCKFKERPELIEE